MKTTTTTTLPKATSKQAHNGRRLFANGTTTGWFVLFWIASVATCVALTLKGLL